MKQGSFKAIRLAACLLMALVAVNSSFGDEVTQQLESIILDSFNGDSNEPYKKSLIEKSNYQVTLENTQHQLKANAKTKTSDVVSYLTKKFANAKASGKSSIIIKSGDIHKELGLVSRMPTVCGAMRKLMKHGDIVHYQPPKGKGATLCIEYFL